MMKLRLLFSGFCLILAFAIAGCSTIPTVTTNQSPLVRGYAAIEAGKNYSFALLEFDKALEEAKRQGNESKLAEIHSASGYVLYLMHYLQPKPEKKPDPIGETSQKSTSSEENQRYTVPGQTNVLDPEYTGFAEARLELALELAKKANNTELQVRIQAYLGLVYASLSQDMAVEVKNDEKDGKNDEKIQHLSSEKQYQEKALDEFKKGSQIISSANKDLALSYGEKLALTKLEKQPPSSLPKLQCMMSDVSNKASRINLMLNIMDQLVDIINNNEQPINQETEDFVQFGQDYAESTINLAKQARCNIQNSADPFMLHAQSLREGFLAIYYERKSKIKDKADLTDKKMTDAEKDEQKYNQGKAVEQILLAIEHAIEANAHDLTMRWQFKLAHLQQVQGQVEQAKLTYRRAIYYVDQVRNNIPVTYPDGTSYYSKTLEPIYRGMANLLLSEASQRPRQEDRQELLLEAIYAMEKLKQSELEDYFNARCLTQQSSEGAVALQQSFYTTLSPISFEFEKQKLKKILSLASEKTAILYPIILEDRLEVLLVHDWGVGKGTIILQKPFIKIKSDKINEEALKLNTELNRGKKYNEWKSSSQQLYQWLIKPLQGDLQKTGIDKLIYIPDGILRLAPVSAFYNEDDNSFIAENYSVVVNNGLLYNNKIRENAAIGKTLFAGLSRPRYSVDKIPKYIQNSALEQAIRRKQIVDKVISKDFSDRDCGFPLTRRPFNEPGFIDKPNMKDNPELYHNLLVENLSLPCLKDEINLLKAKSDEDTVLLNDTFNYKNLVDKIENGDYEFIHIASHGYFNRTAEESFIMTYDEILYINEIENIIKTTKGHQIELVTFSACKTAEGDDRAPLGFSGIAIKAKARNALGALWSVSDQGTKVFMENFYRYLSDNEGDKAKALQQAQQSMIKVKELNHPFFWAPFILVGSW